jgi:geranylgeranyl pyrophosphate synthase
MTILARLPALGEGLWHSDRDERRDASSATWLVDGEVEMDSATAELTGTMATEQPTATADTGGYQKLSAPLDGMALLNQARITRLVQRVCEHLDAAWSADAARLDQVCRYAVLPGHKLFRPILLLESAAAVGGDIEQVLPAAAGAEAGHVASLIHDDIIDGDTLRRGRPSVQVAFGVNDAIVAGDTLIFYLFKSLADCSGRGVTDDRVTRAMAAVADAGLDLCRGQSMEAELCAGYICDIPSYLTMIRLKTSALFRVACRSGAILAGGSDERVEALGTYGECLGTGFQIFDDALGYTSDSEKMGKAATSDIVNRRLTLPFLLARELGGPAIAARLDATLRSDEPAEDRMQVVRDLVISVGALSAAMTMAEDHIRQACEALEVLPPSPSRSTLELFARAAVDRCA